MFAAFLCFVLASENLPIWVSNHRDKTESSLTLLPSYSQLTELGRKHLELRTPKLPGLERPRTSKNKGCTG